LNFRKFKRAKKPFRNTLCLVLLLQMFTFFSVRLNAT